MTDVNVDIGGAVNKLITLKDNKILPKEGIWRYVMIGAISFFVVLILIFIGFVIKPLLYIVIFSVMVIVSVMIGVGVSRWQATQNKNTNL